MTNLSAKQILVLANHLTEIDRRLARVHQLIDMEEQDEEAQRNICNAEASVGELIIDFKKRWRNNHE